MHEIMFADRVLREALNVGAESFLHVEVGELCEITKEEMEEGLRKLVGVNVASGLEELGSVLLQGSGAETDFHGKEMRFRVSLKKSRIKCSCGFVGQANIVDRGHGYCIWNCPKCDASGKNVTVLDGGEIKIVEVE